MRPVAWSFTGIGGVGLGLGGGMEAAVQISANELSDTYAQYSGNRSGGCSVPW